MALLGQSNTQKNCRKNGVAKLIVDIRKGNYKITVMESFILSMYNILFNNMSCTVLKLL